MEELYKAFPGRSEQISLLGSFFTDPPDCVPDSFFVYGLHSVGKTALVTQFLETVNYDYALVNCVECYTSKLLMEPIISQLFSDSKERKCNSLMMFINYLKLFYRQQLDTSKDKQIVIVLDCCEYLDQLGDNYFKAFSKLQVLSSIRALTVIFISHLLPEKFNMDISTVVPIYFPQYSKDDLIKILLYKKPDDCTLHLYQNYLKSALSIFFRVTRDLSEIFLMVSKNFEKYCEPLEDFTGKVDSMALWRYIIPHLKASMLCAYSGTGPSTEKQIPDSQTKSFLAIDLPYYSKYFLIAAYLASYNSPKYDKRLYLKNHGKQRKRANKKNKESELLGPKTFPLDRLLAIFYSIIEDKPNLTANLLSQISTLVELRLLMRVGEGILDKPNYKCIVSFHCVDSVAKTVGFIVSKYLIS